MGTNEDPSGVRSLFQGPKNILISHEQTYLFILEESSPLIPSFFGQLDPGVVLIYYVTGVLDGQLSGLGRSDGFP